MPSVLSKPAAPSGIPISLITTIILDDSDNMLLCIQYAIVCLAIQLKLPLNAYIVELLLEAIVVKFDYLLWNEKFYKRMSVWLQTDRPTGEMIVLKIRSMLEIDLCNHHNYLFGAIFDFAEGHYFLDTKPEHFNDYFGFVSDSMFPKQNVQELQSQILKSRKNLENFCELFSDVTKGHSNTLPPKAPRSLAAIVDRTAVTFPLGAPPFVPEPLTRRLDAPVQSVHEPSVPALVPESQPSATSLVDESVEIVRVLPDPLPRNDATYLILASVKSVLGACVADAVALAANSFAVGNHSTVMVNTGADLDAQVLATEVASVANAQALEAVTTASAALEVAGLVKDAANAGEQIFLEDSTISSVGDTDSSASLLPDPRESDRQTHENGAGGPLSVIQENKDGADQSGKTSPHSPDGKRQAPFTTSAQSPPKGVEDGALGAQTNSSSSNLGSTPPSGQNETFLTHELPDLLKSLAISSKSSFTNLAQSSSNPSGNVCQTPPQVPDLFKQSEEPPPFPLKFLREHAEKSGKGAQSSDIQSKNALSTVGVSRNPHADQPSFPPQGDVGGPQVQELAKSGKPPGSFGGADHPETSSRFNLWRSCILGRKTSSASQPGNSSSSWRRFFHRDKSSNRVNPYQGETGDTSPPVAHSSDTMSSGSAATNPPLSHIDVLSTERTGIGGSGSPRAHSPDDPSEIVPPSAPSLSQELRSAATPAADSPDEKPPTSSGVKIGGIERTWVRSEFDEVEFLVLKIQYAKAQPPPPLLWTHPCLPRVPNLARLARVA